MCWNREKIALVVGVWALARECGSTWVSSHNKHTVHCCWIELEDRMEFVLCLGLEFCQGMSLFSFFV
jgi:hypothetical protein